MSAFDYVIMLFNTIGADDLVKQGAKTSAGMVLSHLSQSNDGGNGSDDNHNNDKLIQVFST